MTRSQRDVTPQTEREGRLAELRDAAFATVVAHEAVSEAMASEDSSVELVTLDNAITRLSVAAIKTLCGETAAADPDHHEKWETFGHSCIGKHLDEGSHECECGYVWNAWPLRLIEGSDPASPEPPMEGDADFDATAVDYRRGSPQTDPSKRGFTMAQLRDALSKLEHADGDTCTGLTCANPDHGWLQSEASPVAATEPRSEPLDAATCETCGAAFTDTRTILSVEHQSEGSHLIGIARLDPSAIEQTGAAEQ